MVHDQHLIVGDLHLDLGPFRLIQSIDSRELRVGVQMLVIPTTALAVPVLPSEW